MIGDKNINSKIKAVQSRLSKARQVDNQLHVNLDTVFKDDDTVYRTLVRIKEELNDFNGSKQNALRKYYIFVNNRKFHP